MDDTTTTTGTTTLAEAMRPAPKRPVLFFTVPLAMLPPESDWGGPLRLGLVALSPDEEIEAAKRSRGDEISINYEFAKMALRAVQEPGGAVRPVNRTEAEQEVLWTRLGPKGRNLVMMVFRDLSAATPEAVQEARASFQWASI